MKFDSKENIKGFIDGIIKDQKLDDRDHLARALGISSSTLYGYIYRLEMPDKVYKKMSDLTPQNSNLKKSTPAQADLSSTSLDDLVSEIERRGWNIDLSKSKNS